LSPIGWFLFLLFSISRHLHFSLQIWIAENTPKSRFTIHIMKVLRQSPIHVHDVVGKFAIYYPHHKGAFGKISAFMKKLAGLCRHHECVMIN
jgi:hypothetical protein